jgi:serine/threonine-protein kinase
VPGARSGVPHPHPSPIGVADLTLAVLALKKAIAAYIEPAAGGHALAFERPSGRRTSLPLPGDLGDAGAMRLSLLAGFDLARGATHLGRLRVRHSSRTVELLAMMNGASQGLSLELRRIVSAPDRADAPSEAGDRVGPYRLFEELGRGGTGVVYRAEHVALQKAVALKLMNPKVVAVGQRAAMLLREGRAASRARHEGIVDVTDFGSTEGGRVYLVMELVPWPTLEALLAGGAIAPQRAVAITRQILRALGAAHGAGVVHRDLKPSNVFVSPDDQVKLGDFGAAAVEVGERPLAEGSATPLWGTPQYMAPEHSRGEADRRTDLYALGVMLFRMLSGKLPFEGSSFVQIMAKHIEAPVPPVMSPHGPLPEAFGDLVRMALAKCPEDRYQRASDMLRDLEQAGLQLLRRGWQKWLPT